MAKLPKRKPRAAAPPKRARAPRTSARGGGADAAGAEAATRAGRLAAEVGALGLIGMALFSELALLSYNRKDPFWDFPDPVDNLCGPVGAALAFALMAPLGWAAHLLPLAALVRAWRVLARRPRRLRGLRLAGWSLLALSLCGLLDSLARSWPELVPSGAGGVLGEWVLAELELFFQGTGAQLVLALLTAASALLATELSLGELGARGARRARSLARGAARAAAASAAAAAQEAVPVAAAVAKRVSARAEPRPAPTRAEARSAEKAAAAAAAAAPAKRPSAEPEVVEHRPTPLRAAPKSAATPKKAERSAAAFQLPDPEQLLNPSESSGATYDRDTLIANSRVLETKLADFGVLGRVVKVHPGPVITMYEFEPAPGIKVSRIVNLSEDLALALRAMSVRIVAPIPGKSVVGVEVPNEKRDPVVFRDLIQHTTYTESRSPLTLALGKDIFGTPVTADLTRMPHLLVAGATGSGKSVFLNSLLCSLFFKASPAEVKLLLVDPKRLEFSNFQGIPHLIADVVTQPKRAAAALLGIVGKMEERYQLMSERGVRNIGQYNRMVREKGEGEILPYIVVVIDELADLMIVAARDVEESLMRLAQMARASGIHLVLATQRPSVDVLTGVIKANFPARIAFQVSSKIDSRTVLDSNGAERLLGEGDSLFVPPGTSRLQRLHAPYVSEQEVQRVVDHLKAQGEPELDPTLIRLNEESEKREERGEEYDEMYDQAVDVVARNRIASISFVQRKLRIGYNRAARLVEQMENQGVIGSQDGTKPREIYVSPIED